VLLKLSFKCSYVRSTNITRISICCRIIFKCVILYSANQELDSVRRSQQAENAKFKAMIKKAEVKTSSLEEMLEQKVKENQELASICDELIGKVGSSE
jgi:Transforming acidic coiled-coil-containing protein (TACC).